MIAGSGGHSDVESDTDVESDSVMTDITRRAKSTRVVTSDEESRPAVESTISLPSPATVAEFCSPDFQTEPVSPVVPAQVPIHLPHLNKKRWERGTNRPNNGELPISQ